MARPLQNLFARILDDRLSGGGTGNLLVASNPWNDHVLVEQSREQRLPLPLRSPPGSGDEPLELKLSAAPLELRFAPGLASSRRTIQH